MPLVRIGAAALATVSGAAMLYVGLYQARAVRKLTCPLFGGCETVADAPFARPFGVPDGFIALGLYALIVLLLILPVVHRWSWPALLALTSLAAIGNALGVYDMVRLGAFCFYCLLTTALSPLLLWAIWLSR
jgi:uncharacterized membrane protein